MQQLISLTKAALLHLLHKARALFTPKEDPVPQEVRDALQQCQNMEDLLNLLFASDFHKDEAFLRLFEKRIEELDAPF
jgi:hypothetical protein